MMDYKDEPCNDECGTKKSILTQKNQKNLILTNSGGVIFQLLTFGSCISLTKKCSNARRQTYSFPNHG